MEKNLNKKNWVNGTRFPQDGNVKSQIKNMNVKKGQCT